MGVRLQTFPAITQEYMYLLLEYTERVISPSLFPLKALSRDHPVLQLTMCLALQNPRVLHSQIAVASIYRARSCSNPNSYVVTGLKHKQEAIRCVKHWLATADGTHADVGVALCITHLASIELMQSNAEGWRIHLDALQTLIGFPNAHNQLDVVRLAIVECELVGCYLFDRQPSFVRRLDRDRTIGSLNHEPRYDEIMSLLSSSKLDISSIDPIVLECIVTLRELTSIAGLETPIPYPSLHIQKYLTARMAVEYKLLQLVADNHLADISRTVCMAAQIYVNRVLRTFERGSILLHKQAERLRSSIEATICNAASDSTLPSCMAWVAIMGAVGAQDGPLRLWFISLLRAACLHTGCTDYQVLRRQLQSLLWSHGSLDNDAILLWREIGGL
ncbi:hypothetical protein FB567DRAFT_521314 [Paraphoma chrysanthemicola]|uniref:Uncharacterized protein n=1 Tax=Paraphoma chrysanthemicola TaxID=798071 RepID=A0A8K0VZY5_9PLEO|nr:hypothetical protein FB567DRAFT_521314 [Paraphoma chrysanthemicola]